MHYPITPLEVETYHQGGGGGGGGPTILGGGGGDLPSRGGGGGGPTIKGGGGTYHLVCIINGIISHFEYELA